MNRDKIPTLITISRIILSLLLFYIKPLSTIFLIVYALCGCSDMLDGYLARKWKVTSQIGAIVDSIADTIFIIVMTFIYLKTLKLSEWMIYWVIIIFIIRISSFTIGYIKFHTIAFLHTWGNKVAGFSLFCLPLVLNVISFDTIVLILCLIASLSALEELVIMSCSKTLWRDIPSIVTIIKKY